MKNFKVIGLGLITLFLVLGHAQNTNDLISRPSVEDEDVLLGDGDESSSLLEHDVDPVSGIITGSEESENLALSEAIDSEGRLTVPFDLAFPEYMGEAKYDANSILVKADNKDIYSIFSTLSTLGVGGYNFVSKVDNDVSWYKLVLEGVTSGEVINSYRQLKTKAKLFDLNYVLDEKSLYVTNDIDVASKEISRSTEIDNCGIDGASHNKHFKDQWYFKQLGLKETYKLLKDEGQPEGGAGTVVAVIDTGVDIEHEDLKNNIWTNTGEIAGNGKDDDSNGYIDDIHGWNFVDNSKEMFDDQGHGTHVAGIIGAENNNKGVVGIAYNAKIMPLKAGDGSGYFTQDRIADAIEYAYMNGADVINMSFGGSTCSLAVQDALEAAYTTSILVAAAGNDGFVNEDFADRPPTLKIIPSFPATLAHVIGVMSIDNTNTESAFTNIDGVPFSLMEYEVYAPGEQIVSTIPSNRYLALNGTSMAAPIVSAIAALLKSKYSDSNQYPTKYFMGQIASANETSAKCFNVKIHGLTHNKPSIVDAYASFTVAPKPSVNLIDYYIFDGTDISANNNADGSLDAGETVYIAPVLRNRWGKSTDTIIKFDTKSSISGEESRYVTLENTEINFGEIGTYSTKDYLILSEDYSHYSGADFNKCLKVKVSDDAPNNIMITFNYLISFRNATDIEDATIYENPMYHFSLKVNRGIFLPKLIKEDMTLTSDKLWIVSEKVEVGPNATLTVEAGTTIQFGNETNNDIFGGQTYSPSLIVHGTLNMMGEFGNMINITTTDVRNNDFIVLETSSNGVVNLQYCSIVGSVYSLKVTNIVHSYIESGTALIHYKLDNGVETQLSLTRTITADSLIKSKLTYYSDAASTIPMSVRIAINKMTSSIVRLINNIATGKHVTTCEIGEFINTSFLIEGNCTLTFTFSIVKTGIISSYYQQGSNHISNDTYRDLYNTISMGDNHTTTNIEKFYFIKDVYNKLIQKGITLPHNPLKHNTDECDCSFPTACYVPFLTDGTNVHLLDGSIIAMADIKKLGLYEYAGNYQIQEGELTLGHLTFNNVNFDGTYGIRIYKPTSTAAEVALVGAYTKDNYLLSAEERKCFDEVYNTTLKESVAAGLASGGGLLSSNINILSSSLMDTVVVKTTTSSVLSEYTYKDLFNFNTTNDQIIDRVVTDSNDGFNMPTIGITDETHEGNSELWPYVTRLEMKNSKGELSSVFTNEQITVTLHFNREMDINVPVRVRFGSYGVSADYEINGEYIDNKTWEGTYTLTTLIESGTQYFNISGGAALTDGFMDIQEPTGRFSFVLDTTQALSKSISGFATDEGILLSWFQDDYGLDTIMGFNIYRSDSENGKYTKINKSIISKEETELLDDDVEPGKLYWYTFVIVLTDLSETSPAGKISVRAKDTMAPSIYHSPVYEGYTDNKLTISCTISDNIGVEEAYLHYRSLGETEYKTIKMANVNNRFSASISSNDITVNGIEYYISASDGTNTVYKGAADNPYTVIIRDASTISNKGDVDGDGEITVKDAYLMLQFIYGEVILEGDQFDRADLNGDGEISTSEAYKILQYINGTISSLEG